MNVPDVREQIQVSSNLRVRESQLPPPRNFTSIGDTGAPAFQGTWQNKDAGYAPAGYYRDPFRRVQLRGVIVHTGAFTNDTAFTLPAGYRPEYTSAFTVCSQLASDPGIVEIDADGSVRMVDGDSAFMSLDGISFRAL